MKVTQNTSVGWGQYFRPTPKNVQKFADALVALSLFATGYAVVMESTVFALICIGMGALGTFGQKLVGNGE